MERPGCAKQFKRLHFHSRFILPTLPTDRTYTVGNGTCWDGQAGANSTDLDQTLIRVYAVYLSSSIVLDISTGPCSISKRSKVIS